MIGARLRAAALAAVLALAPVAAQAAPSRVAVVRPPGPDAAIAEATLRLQAELAAAGFEVIVLAATPGREPRAQVESTAIDPAPFATVAIVATDQGAVADVWVADHLTAKTLVRRVKGGTPSTMAVRAVELLRASLLEIEVAPPAVTSPASPFVPADVARWMTAPKSPSPAAPFPGVPLPPPETPATPAAKASSPARSPFASLSVEAGLSILQGVSGFGTALAPTFRIAHPLPAGFAARLSTFQSVVAPTLEAPAGTATLQHRGLELEALRPFSMLMGRVVPVVLLGAGVWGLRAQGDGRGKLPSVSGTAWTFVADVAGGFAIRAMDELAFTLDLHALLVLPEPVVRIAGVDAGRAGLPMLMATMGVMTSL